MAEITLPNYLQLINSLIDDSRLGEAAAHSRHILEQHPRFLDAYRTLGKALLEQGDYPGAVDVFHRILGAVPADFIAHVGLAIVHKAGDRAKEALWHLERAFEVEPYNPAIRAELQDLYGRRDGLAPEQPELTQGALARFYVKGGLYQQAMLELRQLLDAEPDRVDLRLLLAEALWRADDRIEAAEICRQLLELLPDCLQANAILADILLQTGDAESAETHLRRVQELTQATASTLDPADPMLQAFLLPGALPLPRQVWVDRLSDEDALGMSAEVATATWTGELDLEAADDDFDWLRELQEEGDAILPPAGGEELDWLAEAARASQDEAAQTGEEAGPEAVPASEAEEPSAAASLDWVQALDDEEIDWTETASDRGDVPAWMQAESGDLDWLDQPVAATTPDWLDEAEAAAEAETAAAHEAAGADWPEEPAAPAGAEMDWLDALAEAAADEDDAPEPDDDAGEDEIGILAAAAIAADHFSAAEPAGDVQDEQADEAIREELAMVEQGDERDEWPGEEDAGDLDWLQELGEAAEIAPDDQPQTPAAAGGDVEPGLAWLGALDEAEPPGAEPDEWARDELGEGDAAGDDLSWLDQIAGGEAEPPEEMPTLQWPGDDDEAPQPEADAPPADAPLVPGEPQAADQPIDQELDWLDALASGDAAADDSWLEELELGGDEGRAGEQESEPKLFTEEISGLEWLEEPPLADDLAAVDDDEELGLDWLEEIGAAAADESDWLETAAEDAEDTEDAADEQALSWELEMDAEAEPPALEPLPAAVAHDAPADVVDEGEELAWLDEMDAEDEEAAAAAPPAADDEAFPDLIAAEQFMVAEEPEPPLDWLEAEDEAGPETEAEPDSAGAVAGPQPGAEEAELEEALTWLDEAPEGVAFAPEEAVPQDLDEAMAWLDAGEAEDIDPDQVPEDLDEAMAWLEQLAAQQGAPLDELPSLAAAGESDAPAEPEEAPLELELPAEETPELNLEWMEALAAADEEPAPAADEAPALAADEDTFDVPEDLDEAMAWLEQLAAQQGAPLDELPSVAGDAAFLDALLADDVAQPAPELEEEPTVAEAAAADELDEAMAWLDELATQQPAQEYEEAAAPPEIDDEHPEAEAEPDAGFDFAAEEAVPALPVDEQPTPQAMVVPDVAMMYLDSLVEHGGEPADTAESAGDPAGLAAEIPDDLDSMMAWLEQLAGGAEPELAAADPAEEPVALEETAAYEEPVDFEEATATELAEIEETLAFEEEAAYEEQVVFEEEVTAEELVEIEEPLAFEEPAAYEEQAVFEEEVTAEELVEIGEPLAFEEEAAYEEQVSFEEEAAAEEPAESDQQTAVAEYAAPEEQDLPDFLAGEATEPALELDEDAPSFIFDAEAEASAMGLDWLAEDTDAEAAEAETEGAFDFEEVPEDPDEVMAWLERLAARQGAPLDELPTVDEVSDEVETPDWLAADLAAAEAEAEAEASSDDLTAEPAPSAEADVLDEAPPVAAAEETAPEEPATAEEAEWLSEEASLEWLDAVTSDEPGEGLSWLEETAAAATVPQESDPEQLGFPPLDEDSESLMPDWLTFDEEAWQEEESDIASWLVAEEEMSQVSLETGAPLPSSAPPDLEPTAPPEAALPAQRLPAAADMDARQLESARAALDGGDLAGALNRYQSLLERGAGLNVLIGDLELAARAGADPTLCRVLGDAYMQNGQLERALEIYRRGLDLL